MKLKPLLLLAGAAGAAAVVIKRRGGAQQVVQAAPQPVKDAAQRAGETVAHAVQNAPEPVQSVVDKVTPDVPDEPRERYEPPVEALAQEPREPGGLPSDDVPVHEGSTAASEPGSELNTPDHAPPEGAVVPDTSAGDPLVREQEQAAAGAAGAIGGNVDDLAANDAAFPEDPASRPVVEGAGDEDPETFEAREGEERGNREREF